MRRMGRRLAVGAIVFVNIIAFGLPAGAAKPAPSSGGGNVNLALEAFDNSSKTWTRGNTSGYAELQVIPYRVLLSGSGTITTLQTVFDHSRGGVPGIQDLVNPAYLSSYPANSQPSKVFYYCTGARTNTVTDPDPTPGATGCTPIPVYPTDPSPAPSGPYAVGPGTQTASGVVEGYYTWHNIPVPANTPVTLLFGAWLALGSHNYPGSALHVSIGTATMNGGSVSFGSKDVPIPVNQIIATETVKKVNGGDSATVTIGDTVHFSITVSTFGPKNSTQNLVITDSMDPCLSYVAGSANPAPDSTPTVDPQTGVTTIVWTRNNVSNGSTLTFTFDAKAVSPGTCNNTVVTTSNISPPSSDTVPVTVNGLSDVFVTKTCPDASSPGATVTHTIDFGNSGTAAAAGAKIVDVLGQGLTYADNATLNGSSITPTVQNNTPSTGQTTLTFTLGTLAVNSTGEIQYKVTIANSFTNGQQSLTDTATISTTSAQSNTSNDTATCSTSVTFQPDLNIHKQCPSQPTLNSTVQHTITFGNDGHATATGVTITDVLDNGLTYADTAKLNGQPITPTVTNNNDGTTTLVFSIGTLTVGSTGTITYNVTITKSGTLNDTATISANETDANTADNSATCTSGINFTDVFITKSCPSVAQPGDTVTHTLDFGNNGNQTATGVVITDVLDPGLTYVTGSAKLNGNSITPVVTNNPDGTTTLTFTIGSLAAGATDTITYSVRIPSIASSPGSKTFNDTASISTTSTSESNTANNSSGPCRTTVEFKPVLNVSKTGCPNTTVPGGLLTYTISFSNTGSATAANAVLVDTIPAGTEVADAGGGTVSNGTVTWQLGDLAPGASGTKTLVVLVDAANGSLLVNKVSLTSGTFSDSFQLSTPVSNAGAITHGNAYNLNVDLLGSTLIDKLGNVSTVAPGSPQTAAMTAIPVSIPGVITVGVLNTGSVSSLTNQATTTSYANVAGYPNSPNPHGLELLGGAITANAVHGVSHSFAGPFLATNDSLGSSFADLRINGTQFCLNPTPDPTCANIAPNTTVDVRAPGNPTTVIARAVLYEKSGTASLGSNGSLNSASQTVNMIHVTLLQPFGPLPSGAQIIVSHAQSDAKYPSGFACGTTPSTISGLAYTAFAQGTIGSPPSLVATGQIGDAELPITGGSDSDTTTAQVPGVVTTQTAQNTTSGALGPNPNATSESKTQYVNLLGGLITADLLDVSSTSTATGSSASTTFGSTFVNLVINGTPIGGTPDPNTIIAIPPSQTPDGTLIFIVLNEQIASSDGTKNTQGDVNAIHVWVLKGQAIQLEVVVAHAHSDAHHS